MAEWLNKIRYNGTDYNIGNTGGDLYSTEEQVVGVWNGKPLYRKVVYIEALPNNGQVLTPIGVDNIEYIKTLEGMATIANNSSFFPMNNIRPDGLANGVGCRATNTDIIIETGTDRSMFHAYVIVEYTKTTDVAGDVPSNIGYSGNYSTSEEVVGTYKGKPLYRKIVEFSFEKTTTDVVSGNVELNADIEKIVNFNGNFTSSTTHDGIIFSYPANSLYSSTEFARVYFVERTTTGVKGLYYDFANARTGVTITAEVVIEYTKTTD